MGVKRAYRGRFAPSPTGPLHLGSLVSALASYLDCHANRGIWLLRIEDIDPPREIAGASQAIINSLKAHGLTSTETITFQSDRLADYQAALIKLRPHCYRCNCPRARIRELKGVYDGRCRDSQVQPPGAVRLRIDQLSEEQQYQAEHFNDLIQGPQHQNMEQIHGDIIIQRRDQLIAYQLAVVVDDIAQGITHIIRGDDLLSSTARQRCLHLLLGNQPPEFGHVPVVKNELGQKLSKQHHAPALDDSQAMDNLIQAFKHLYMEVPANISSSTSIEQLLRWGSDHWPHQWPA